MERRAETQLNETSASITNFDKVHLKRNCVDESILRGRHESIPVLFGLSVPPGFIFHKERTSILYKFEKTEDH